MVRERFRVVRDLFARPSVDAYVCTFYGCCVGWRGPGIKSEYSRVWIHILWPNTKLYISYFVLHCDSFMRLTWKTLARDKTMI